MGSFTRRAVSNIPSNAISAALTPIQRQQNDALRARQVQSAKALHHNEDVDELDDTGVDSVRDDQQNRGQQQESEDKHRKETEDTVDIKNAPPVDPAQLSDSPAPPAGPPHRRLAAPLPSLDISA